MKLDALFSSDSDEWETPDAFFAKLNTEFNFTIDVCATAENAKCREFYSKETNGLAQPWDGRVWCNPPYSQIALWVAKAFQEKQRRENESIVMLIPSRTDTAYWHDFVMRAYDVRFIRGRLKFKGGKSCAPFPSAVIVW
jgi:site-specific DNA-methyltransferase (adenine-specific)